MSNYNTNKFTAWMGRHKAVVFSILLIITLLSVVLYYQVRLSTLESEYIIEKNNYEQQSLITYQQKVDSLNHENAYRISKVFSWSVRGELMRGNNEQVSLLFGQFIKTPGISKISLIDPTTKVITIATDRKVEGEVFDKPALLNNPSQEIQNNSLVIKVLGLNDVIGLLYFEYNNLEK